MIRTRLQYPSERCAANLRCTVAVVVGYGRIVGRCAPSTVDAKRHQAPSDAISASPLGIVREHRPAGPCLVRLQFAHASPFIPIVGRTQHPCNLDALSRRFASKYRARTPENGARSDTGQKSCGCSLWAGADPLVAMASFAVFRTTHSACLPDAMHLAPCSGSDSFNAAQRGRQPKGRQDVRAGP